MRHAVGLLLLFAAGCASRLDDPAILPYGGRDGAIAASSDGGINATCREVLTPIAIGTLQIVDELTALTDGAAIRVRLLYQRPSCWFPATTDAVLQTAPGTDTVLLTAYLWRHDPLPGEPCGTIDDSRLVSISDAVPSLSQPNLVVKDSESVTQVNAVIGPRPIAACTPIPIGQTCQLDCQCVASNPRTRCLVGWNHCEIPCSEQVDCPEAFMCDVLGKSTPVFGMCTPGNQCANPPDCLHGENCTVSPQGTTCTPYPASPGGSCACDDNCAAGRICTSDGICQIPCATSNECPMAVPHCQSGVCTAS